MKTLLIIISIQLTAYFSYAQKQKRYPLKIYLEKNAKASIGLYDTNGVRIPIEIAMPLSTDSILMFVPEGKYIFQLNSKDTIRYQLYKNPFTDTLFIHSKNPRK